MEDLYKRGLEEQNLKLIATDGGAGLIVAVESIWPYVPRQRCWAHKLRNMAGKLREINEKTCLDAAKLIYTAPNRKEAAKRFRSRRDKWIKWPVAGLYGYFVRQLLSGCLTRIALVRGIPASSVA